ncbi:MAG: MurT ligase domain-containing protein [Thermomicrobiales bacterium]
MIVSSIVQRARLTTAVGAARIATAGIKVLKRGGGTAAPGAVALRIDPLMVSKITSTMPRGVVIVAGTNGKTTTSRLLASILSESGFRVAHNRSGSNLVRGVAAALAQQTSLRGGCDADIAVIEADEAAMPEIARLTQPRMIVLTNLFRDQLDRYGELNAIASKWEPVLKHLEPEAVVVANADDPRIVDIVDGTPAVTWYFGVEPGVNALQELPHAADRALCTSCGADLRYEVLTLSHLGAWFCPKCGRKRPEPDVLATDVRLHGVDSVHLTLRVRNHESMPLSVSVPGLYTVYNSAAAATAALAIGVEPPTIARATESFQTPFGRLEEFTIDGRRVTLALVKNPVAFNETLRMIAGRAGDLRLPTLIAINDLDADGRDVSWLWDVDFEMLADGTEPVATTGIRAADMANRLKYAGVETGRIRLLSPDLEDGLHSFVGSLGAGGQGFVLATYTAMLGLRKVIVDGGFARDYWEE